MVSNSENSTTFRRTAFTWLAYGMLGYYAFAQTSLGPIMPLLRSEFALSYTVGGLHASAFAFGSIFVGLFGDRIAAWVGNKAAFWGSGVGLALAILGLTLAPGVAFTLPAVVVMGFFGGLLLVMVQATLSDEHGPHRSIVLLEANIMAMVAGTIVPLLVGGFARLGWGWRPALLSVLALWMGLVLLSGRVVFPTAVPEEKDADGRRRPLPRPFWIIWLITFLAVAAEWCLALWTADFLRQAHQLAPGTAALFVAIFTGAGVVGRLTGSRLARRYATTHLLIFALLVLLAGFPLFWLVPVLLVRLVGLFFAGFGVTMLYPLCVAAGTEMAPQQANRASARVSLAAGVTILVNPQALGVLADRVGIMSAMGVTGLFALSALLLAFLLLRWERKGG